MGFKMTGNVKEPLDSLSVLSNKTCPVQRDRAPSSTPRVLRGTQWGLLQGGKASLLLKLGKEGLSREWRGEARGRRKPLPCGLLPRL